MNQIGYFVWWKYVGCDGRFYEFVGNGVRGESMVFHLDDTNENVKYNNGEEAAKAYVYKMRCERKKYGMILTDWGYVKAFADEPKCDINCTCGAMVEEKTETCGVI